MGVLSKIQKPIVVERPLAPRPADPRPPAERLKNPPQKISSSQISHSDFFPSDFFSRPPSPCQICGSPIFWESVARDKNLYCSICEPPPAVALVGREVTINGVPGDPATIWENLSAAIQRAQATFGDDRDGQTAERVPVATWTPPDEDGWCYAIDCEGAGRARRASDRDDPHMQYLDETRDEYDSRLAAGHAALISF